MKKSKPILIEISRLIFRLIKGKTITGIDRVTLAYIQQYADQAQAVFSIKGHVNILNKRNSDELFRLLCENRPKVLSKQVLNLLSEHFFNNDVELDAYADCLYLNLNHKGIESSWYIKKIQQLKLKTIFFIHDLIPVYYPEYCREQEQEKHIVRVQHMLKYGYVIIVNSEFTKQQVLKFAKEHGMNAPEIIVSWLSSDLHLQSTEPRLVPQLRNKRYFVVLATIEARKNHLLLLQIWQRLIQNLGDQAPYLVLVGQRGWEAEQVFDLLDRCDVLKKRVIECSSSCDVELRGALLHSQALLFPSFVEGFGLPLVEALSLGVPVIASDIDVFQEIGQGVPEFLDTLDTKLWYETILAYSKNTSLLREAQLERIKLYQHWEWQDHFNTIKPLLGQAEAVAV